MRWAGNVASMGEKRIFVGKPEGKRPIQRRRWEDDIKMDLRVLGWSGVIRLRIGTSGGLL
jgi:hypothetical protein